MIAFDEVTKLKEIDRNIYLSNKTWRSRFSRGTYGGHLIAQAATAASKTVGMEYHVHSIHTYFLRPGDTNTPVIYKVSCTRNENSFSSRTVSALQQGQPIITVQVSFHKQGAEASSVFDYQLFMPKVPHHSQLHSVEEYVGLLSEEVRASYLNTALSMANLDDVPISMKPIDPDTFFRRKSNQSRNMACWFKVTGPIGDNENVHRIAAAYVSDWTISYSSVACDVTQPFSLFASLDHAIWFHRPARIDEWVLYEGVCHSVANSRAFCYGRIWTDSGELTATVAQEIILRSNAANNRSSTTSKL